MVNSLSNLLERVFAFVNYYPVLLPLALLPPALLYSLVRFVLGSIRLANLPFLPGICSLFFSYAFYLFFFDFLGLLLASGPGPYATVPFGYCVVVMNWRFAGSAFCAVVAMCWSAAGASGLLLILSKLCFLFNLFFFILKNLQKQKY